MMSKLILGLLALALPALFSRGQTAGKTNNAGSTGTVLVREPFLARDPHLELNGERIDVADADRYQL